MRELALNVMDITQNSISAGATLIHITVEESASKDRLSIAVEDNGCGMTEEQVRSVIDPFYTTRTTRKAVSYTHLDYMDSAYRPQTRGAGRHKNG